MYKKHEAIKFKKYYLHYELLLKVFPCNIAFRCKIYKEIGTLLKASRLKRYLNYQIKKKNSC